MLLEPVAVTKDNVKDTVIKDEFITPDELCTGAYAVGLQRSWGSRRQIDDR